MSNVIQLKRFTEQKSKVVAWHGANGLVFLFDADKGSASDLARRTPPAPAKILLENNFPDSDSADNAFWGLRRALISTLIHHAGWGDSPEFWHLDVGDRAKAQQLSTALRREGFDISAETILS